FTQGAIVGRRGKRQGHKHLFSKKKRWPVTASIPISPTGLTKSSRGLTAQDKRASPVTTATRENSEKHQLSRSIHHQQGVFTADKFTRSSLKKTHEEQLEHLKYLAFFCCSCHPPPDF
ncbi:hypothetical protein CHARACLAT_018560, partial [Characodon lateralis]|nr:hypothetical protein [Characodon lateralis]